MKKYLFGLGAMVVGAGLMFVMTQNEVQADAGTEKCVCSFPTVIQAVATMSRGYFSLISHCRCGKLDCVTNWTGSSIPATLSCHKSGGIFR